MVVAYLVVATEKLAKTIRHFFIFDPKKSAVAEFWEA